MIERLQERFYRCYNFRNKFPYSKDSFFKGIGGYLIILLICLGIRIFGDVGREDNNYLDIGIIVTILIIGLNVLGLVFFKGKKTKKYSVIVPYISGLLFLIFPVLIMNLTAEQVENTIIQGLIILFIGPLNLVYQMIIIEFLENPKESGMKQIIFMLPVIIIFIMGSFLVIFEDVFMDSYSIFSWAVFFIMSVMSMFLFPQFMIVINYWKKPVQTKSRYDNVLDKLK